MAVTSPRIVSPLDGVRNCENIPSYITPPRFNNGLPLQQSVSSASPMPASPRVGSISALLSTPQYIEQIKAVIEQQRQLHEKERTLWNTENQALQDKVAQLEASLRWYKERNGGSEVISPLDDRSGTTFGTFGGYPPGTVGGIAPATGPKAIAASTGDEFWRGAGGKSDAMPTRTFSDPTTSSRKLENRQMPSIPENAISHIPGRALSADTTIPPPPHHHHADQNIDGIIFKPTALAPPSLKKGTSPDSLSPGQSPPARSSPGTIQLASNLLGNLYDPYLKDAGHTPHARLPPNGLDGTSSDTVSPLTPPTLSGHERPPLEPRPSVARPPHERALSYFPPVIDRADERDEDVALTGPLSLTNNDSEDRSFLNALSTKLRHVARSQTSSPDENAEAAAVADARRASAGRGRNGPRLDAGAGDEFEGPTLRIKRSMNFGSSWGASSCGKGF